METPGMVSRMLPARLRSCTLLILQSSRGLPVIGAILTILSLGFDTFSQQVIASQYRTGNASKFSGNVPRAETYDDLGPSGLNVSAKAAIHSGVMSPNITSVKAFCPSGDCSWPVTPTVGVCGACMDVSGSLQTNSLETNGQGQPLVLTINPGSKSILDSPAVGGSSVDMLIADFNIVGSTGQALANPTATECALWFCLQAMEIEQEAGCQTTNVTHSWNQASSPSDSSDAYTFTSVPLSFNAGTDSNNFNVSKSTFDAYVSYFDSSMNGSVASSDDGHSFSSDYAQAIWLSFDSLDSWIQRVATSMTNYVRVFGSDRLASPPAMSTYDGTAYENETFIQIRWPWLGFPAAMVLGSLLYLIATIVQASGSGAHIWKNDPLPLLLADVDPNIKLQADRGMQEPDGLFKVVGSRRVSLNDEEGRWVFRASEAPPLPPK
jgi:hypothetical protein